MIPNKGTFEQIRKRRNGKSGNFRLSNILPLISHRTLRNPRKIFVNRGSINVELSFLSAFERKIPYFTIPASNCKQGNFENSLIWLKITPHKRIFWDKSLQTYRALCFFQLQLEFFLFLIELGDFGFGNGSKFLLW